jgi:hypothetical protein
MRSATTRPLNVDGVMDFWGIPFTNGLLYDEHYDRCYGLFSPICGRSGRELLEMWRLYETFAECATPALSAGSHVLPGILNLERAGVRR